jgi:hypothetical protein
MDATTINDCAGNIIKQGTGDDREGISLHKGISPVVRKGD